MRWKRFEIRKTRKQYEYYTDSYAIMSDDEYGNLYLCLYVNEKPICGIDKINKPDEKVKFYVQSYNKNIRARVNALLQQYKTFQP